MPKRPLLVRAYQLMRRAAQLLLLGVELPFRYVFGRDLFISYSRGDSRKYVPNLALALQGRMPKLSIYLDRWIAPPSGSLTLSLRLQLRWSSILVVICTEKAVASSFVKDEIARFARLRRKVVVVDVDGVYGVVRGQMPWLTVGGADPEEESGEAVERGEPSESVIERILKSIEFTKQDRRLRRAVWGTLAFVALSVGGAGLYSFTTVLAADAKAAAAESRAAAAAARALGADEKAAASESKAVSAEQREAVAKQREGVAVQAQGIAEGRALEASRKAAAAEGLRATAEAKAGEARVEAQKQQRIALARRLAADSNLAEDPHLEQAEKKVLLAVESMRRSPSAGAYRNLVNGIKMIPLPRVTVSHDGKVTALAFDPKGSSMVTAVGEVLWVRSSGDLRHGGGFNEPQKIPHAGRILRVEFSPEGKYLATLTREAGVRIWWFPRMYELPPILHKGALTLAFSNDENIIAVGGAGLDPDAAEPQKVASVWQIGTDHREVASVEAKGMVLDVSFSADRETFMTVNSEGEGRSAVNFWNAQGGPQREPAKGTLGAGNKAPVEARGDAIRGGFSPNGKHVAVVYQADRKGAYLVSQYNGVVSFLFRQLEFIQFSPDGRFLVASSADDESNYRSTSIWDVTGEQVKELRHLNSRSIIREGAFSNDGRYLALVSLEREHVQVWDPLVGRVAAYIKLKGRGPLIAFTGDAKFLALSSGSEVTLWPIEAGWQSSEAAHQWSVATALSPNGKLIATVDGSTVRLLDAADGHEVSSIKTRCAVRVIAFDWEGERLATAGGECGVWVWRLGGSNEGTPVRREGGGEWAAVHGLAFSRDGRHLAVADGRAHVVGIADPSDYTHVAAEGEEVLSVAFSADGERVVTAYSAGLDIWDRCAPKRKPKRLNYQILNPDHNNPVVSFGDDGYLVMADDYAAHIWDVSEEPWEVGSLDLRDESDSRVAHSVLSPGGSFVASTLLTGVSSGGGWGDSFVGHGSTTIWQVRPAAVMANACGRLSRPLTKSEWGREFGNEPYRESCAGSAVSPDRRH